MLNTSSEEEDNPIFDDIDYDQLTTTCLSRTNGRKRGSMKKSRRSRESLPSKGSTRSLKGLSGGSGKKSSTGKHGRSDMHKKHRNVERVFKELGTVLQVFDFGVMADSIEDYPDDRTDVLGSMDDGTTDFTSEPSDAVPIADAVAEIRLSNEEPEGPESWEDDVVLTVAEVVAQNSPVGLTAPVQVGQHIVELVKKGDEARTKLQLLKQRSLSSFSELGDAYLSQLGESLNAMNAIVGEMRENGRSCSGWSSASSRSSLSTQRDQALLLLLRSLQELYTEFVDTIASAMHLGQQWFSSSEDPETVTDSRFDFLLRLNSIQRQLIDFEVIMRHEGIGPAKVFLTQEAETLKEHRIKSLITAMHVSVRHYQTASLVKKHITTNTDSTDRHRIEETLQKLWNGIREVTYRVASWLPSMKQELNIELLLTYIEAVHLMKRIQDNEEVQEVIQNAKCKLLCDNDAFAIVSEEDAKAQQWLIPCLQKLHSVSNQLFKYIRKKAIFTNDVIYDEGGIVWELRREFTGLILISIVRVIRLTKGCEILGVTEIQTRKELGIKMLHLIKRYDHSPLSDNFEEDEWYETFRELTEKLLNNVLCFQTRLQLLGIEGIHDLGVSAASSMEMPVFDQKYDEYVTRLSHPSNRTSTASSSIATGNHEDTETRQSQPLSKTDQSMSSGPAMINPFRDIAMNDGRNFSETFCTRPPAIGSEEFHNPLSVEPTARTLSLKAHPLSYISEVYPSGPPSLDDCPNLENFYIIKKDELVLGPRLGCGSTGQVFKMTYRGSPVAVKIMNSPGLLDAQQRLVHESEMHCRLAHHPNIVQFYGQCIGVDGTDQAVGLVMELCDVGSLLEVIREARGIRSLETAGHDMTRYEKSIGYAFYRAWPLRLKIACDIVAGMNFLHSRNIVHRDLTSYNVVISHGGRQGYNWTAKVCDFERSRHVPPGEKIPRSDTIANSCAWSAPEVIRDEAYSTQADLYSMGVILWEILTLELPWNECRDAYHIMAVVQNKGRLTKPTSGPDTIPELPLLTALLDDLWKECPEERSTMEVVHQRLVSIKHDLEQRIKTARNCSP